VKDQVELSDSQRNVSRQHDIGAAANWREGEPHALFWGDFLIAKKRRMSKRYSVQRVREQDKSSNLKRGPESSHSDIGFSRRFTKRSTVRTEIRDEIDPAQR